MSDLSNIVAAMALAVSGAPDTPPASHMKMVREHFRQCLMEAAPGREYEVTIRYALTKDGALRGAPKIIWLRLAGGESPPTKNEIIEDLQNCPPVSLTPDLARTVPDKIFVMRLEVGNRRPDLPSQGSAIEF